MKVKRLAGSLLLSVAPLLLVTPVVFAGSGTVITRTTSGAPASGGLQVVGVQDSAAAGEVAGARAGVDQNYELRVLGWPQPAGQRVQAGMVSTRALVRDDSRSGADFPEVAGVQAAAVEVAGVQASDIGDAEYLSAVLAWPQLAGIRVHPGMVGLSALLRDDSSPAH